MRIAVALPGASRPIRPARSIRFGVMPGELQPSGCFVR
jgi:hypothetical protein